MYMYRHVCKYMYHVYGVYMCIMLIFIQHAIVHIYSCSELDDTPAPVASATCLLVSGFT